MANVKISGTGSLNSTPVSTSLLELEQSGGTSEHTTLGDAIQKAHGLGNGILKIAAGLMDVATEGTDYYKPGGTDVAVADGGTGASTAGGARTNLGLVINTDVQAYDADLATIAGLTATSDNFLQAKAGAWASRTPTQVTADLIAMVGDSGSGGTKGLVPAPASGDATKYLKGDGTWATITAGDASTDTATSVDGEIALFKSTTGKLLKRATVTGLLKAASGVLSAATAGTDYYNPGGTDVAVADGGTGASTAGGARTNLGLVINTDVQAYDADLATIAGLTATTDNFLQAKASAWASRTPAQVKTDLDIPDRPDAIYQGTTGDYWAAARFGSVSTANLVTGRAYYTPFYVPKSTAVDRVGITVTVGAVAGTTIELGLYADTNGRPGALIDSYGTVAGDAAASVEITISKTLAVGWYWYAVLPIFGSGTLTVRTVANLVNQTPGTSLANALTQNNFGMIQSSLATLPNPAVAASQSTIGLALAYRLA